MSEKIIAVMDQDKKCYHIYGERDGKVFFGKKRTAPRVSSKRDTPTWRPGKASK